MRTKLAIFNWRAPFVSICSGLPMLLAACGPVESVDEVTTPGAVAEKPDSPGAVIGLARDAMLAQQGFRGGFAYLPSLLAPRITYGAPDAMLVEDMGDEVFWSSDGRRWRTSPEQGAGLAGFFRTTYDPRMALRYGTDAEAAGEEEVRDRRHYVVRMKLDARRLVDDLGPVEPSALTRLWAQCS